MSKITPTKPLLIMLYGFPGSGKTHFARQLAESVSLAHVQGDRIRHELFEEPRRDKQENEVVSHLMDYMAEEFLSAGVSVIYDTDIIRAGQRRYLRDLARRVKAQHLLVWLQVDAESAFLRTQSRDRRKTDDKYARGFDRRGFDAYANTMQNPTNEDYVVISGKHTFKMQRSAVMKKMYEIGAIDTNGATRVVKPELVNLVPHQVGGRVDMNRRNIVIR